MKHRPILATAIALALPAWTLCAQDAQPPRPPEAALVPPTPAEPGARPEAPRPQGQPAGPHAMGGLFGVLDANHDGVVDAGELSHAAEVLGKLDRNGDGKLTPDELHLPGMERRQRDGEGRGPRADGDRGPQAGPRPEARGEGRPQRPEADGDRGPQAGPRPEARGEGRPQRPEADGRGPRGDGQRFEQRGSSRPEGPRGEAERGGDFRGPQPQGPREGAERGDRQRQEGPLAHHHQDFRRGPDAREGGPRFAPEYFARRFEGRGFGPFEGRGFDGRGEGRGLAERGFEGRGIAPWEHRTPAFEQGPMAMGPRFEYFRERREQPDFRGYREFREERHEFRGPMGPREGGAAGSRDGGPDAGRRMGPPPAPQGDQRMQHFEQGPGRPQQRPQFDERGPGQDRPRPEDHQRPRGAAAEQDRDDAPAPRVSEQRDGVDRFEDSREEGERSPGLRRGES